MYCLPPHTTNILQLLDVLIFKPLKVHFSKITDNLKLVTMGHTVPLCVKRISLRYLRQRLKMDNRQQHFFFISSSPNENNTATSTTPAVPGSSTGASFNSLPGGSFFYTSNTFYRCFYSIALVDCNNTNQSSHCSKPFTSTPTKPVNPHVAAGIIPASSIDAFIFPAPKPNKQKNTRNITKARVLTSDEHRQSFREKVEKKELEEKATEERKKERE
ncbi:uncharacterized protein LOC130657447 [Hydractinia symbiolongicarpus]|uniref:uncharacterized protein LOC130657447 n=1 Tax=Hydractinia symbiolongicarpus TaxID=13093 RepID=UPI00254CFCF6|nr:uncharacterized protein LOC130657447 [Hydractinia symbiolongicarpus]